MPGTVLSGGENTETPAILNRNTTETPAILNREEFKRGHCLLW